MKIRHKLIRRLLTPRELYLLREARRPDFGNSENYPDSARECLRQSRDETRDLLGSLFGWHGEAR